jgi:hypothetical protein
MFHQEAYRQIADILIPDFYAPMITSVGLDRKWIVFDRGDDPEACLLQAERQPSTSGKKIDRLRLQTAKIASLNLQSERYLRCSCRFFTAIMYVSIPE